MDAARLHLRAAKPTNAAYVQCTRRAPAETAAEAWSSAACSGHRPMRRGVRRRGRAARCGGGRAGVPGALPAGAARAERRAPLPAGALRGGGGGGGGGRGRRPRPRRRRQRAQRRGSVARGGAVCNAARRGEAQLRMPHHMQSCRTIIYLVMRSLMRRGGRHAAALLCARPGILSPLACARGRPGWPDTQGRSSVSRCPSTRVANPSPLGQVRWRVAEALGGARAALRAVCAAAAGGGGDGAAAALRLLLAACRAAPALCEAAALAGAPEVTRPARWAPVCWPWEQHRILATFNDGKAMRSCASDPVQYCLCGVYP